MLLPEEGRINLTLRRVSRPCTDSGQPPRNPTGDEIPMTGTCILRTFALVAFSGFLASVPARAADPVFPTGSRIGFVPPASFQVSTRFPGFEDKDSGASILIVDMPAQAYSEVEKQMTKENVKKQGIVEEKRETLSLATGKAILIVGQQEAEGRKIRKWIFLASAPEALALVAVQVPDASNNAYWDATIRTALTTMAVRATVPIEEQLSLLPIKFDEFSGLRPIRVVGTNGAFLTEGPKDTLDASEQPLLIVSVGTGGPQQASDRDNFARNLFTGLADFKDVRIVGTDMLRLGGGLQTHQILAEAKDAKTDAPMKFVQWVRFGAGGFLRIVGVARADAWADAFPRFRAVRDGVGPR